MPLTGGMGAYVSIAEVTEGPNRLDLHLMLTDFSMLLVL